MDVAREGQSLAAALNHATLNIANALGAWLGGLVLAAGYSYAWPSRVSVVLPLAGMAVFAVGLAVERRARRSLARSESSSLAQRSAATHRTACDAFLRRCS